VAAAVGTRAAVDRARPGHRYEEKESPRHAAAVLVSVERNRRHLLGEEAEGAFDVGLVLRALGGGADAHGTVRCKCCVDLGGVIGRLVVEQLRERRRACRGEAVAKALDDGGAVLGVVDGEANEGAGVGIDLELEVEGKGLVVEDDAHELAVTDPLRPGKEGLEGATERQLIGRAPGTSLAQADTRGLEDVSEELTSHGDAQVMAHVLGEVDESAVPALPGGEYGLELRQGRVGLGRRRRDARHRLGCRCCWRVSGREPRFERAHGDIDQRGEGFEREVRVLLMHSEDEVAEPSLYHWRLPRPCAHPGCRVT